MESLLPILLILALFPLSFFSKRWLKMPFGFVLPSLITVYFLIMTFIDREHIYRYLFFVILGSALAWRGLKASGILGGHSSKV